MQTFQTVVEKDQATIQAGGRGIAKALNVIAERAGRPLTMGTKIGRLEIQKLVYLLRHVDYPSARKYAFNIYLNGPYSPELAQVYYALGDSGIRGAGSKAEIPADVVRTLADALAKGPDFLEALTTVIDGKKTLGQYPAAIGWARSIKPHLNDPTWRGVQEFLAAHPVLT